MDESEQPGKLAFPITAKRYFTIGEVGELCEGETHVLRYWGRSSRS
jgi:hypothetical protein